MQPFRIIDGDDPGDDQGGWDESGNVDIPGVLVVDTVQGSGSSSPELTTTTFRGKTSFSAAVAFVAAMIELEAAAASTAVLGTIVTGDAFDRWRLRADGRQDWGSGAGARDTALYRASAGVLATDTSFSLATAGGGLLVKTGANNSTAGTVTLVAGTATVTNTKVTASSMIFLTAQTTGAGPGALRISARTAATSFVITSSSGTDTSSVAWLLVEPAP
jgi:hypothetical protein